MTVVLHFPELREDLRKNWERILPITLEFNEVYTNFSEETLREMAAKVKNFYFGDKEIGVEETRQELTDAYSDRFFNLGVREAAILMSKYTPVYLYQFCYNGGGVSVTKFFGIEGNWGEFSTYLNLLLIIRLAEEIGLQFQGSPMQMNVHSCGPTLFMSSPNLKRARRENGFPRIL